MPEAQQTLKLQIRETANADGAALADGEHALHHAVAEAKAVQGHVMLLDIVLEVQVEAKDVLLEAQHADGPALADGEHALYHAAAELRPGQGDAMLAESAQEAQANQGRDAILKRAVVALVQRVIEIVIAVATIPVVVLIAQTLIVVILISAYKE